MSPSTEVTPAPAPRHEPMDVAEVVRAFRLSAKRVVTFLGFGELGYEEPAGVRQIIRRELSKRSASDFLVNTGTLIRVGGLDGIADVYPLAKELGFETTGIHPSIALGHRQTHCVSPYSDRAYFVRDTTWGGLHAHGTPSPTLRTLLEVSDAVVVIGGGKHAAEEMLAFLREGIPVTFHPAQMNHAMSRHWASDAGVSLESFDGAACGVWAQKESAPLRPLESRRPLATGTDRPPACPRG